jgi:sodium/potassium-transporting ATPase subunit alpha
MFNIILIVSGLLEYILLGIDFHVSLHALFFHPLRLSTLFPQDNIQNTYLGGILISVAFLNAFIEFYQLQKSEAILASFLAMIPPSCRVLRDGSLQNIPAADLVKGDIVLLVSIISCPFLLPTSDHIRAARRRQDPSRSPYLFLDGFESRQQ